MKSEPLTTTARNVVLSVVVACAMSLMPHQVPLAAADSVMARSVEQLAMPTDTKAKPLKQLFMGSRQAESVAEITSIRLKSVPEEGADPLRVTWVVTLSNTRPITQVVNLKISIRDEQGKRLASGRGRLRIATRTSDKEFEVKVKVKAAAWQAASKLELQADWIG